MVFLGFPFLTVEIDEFVCQESENSCGDSLWLSLGTEMIGMFGIANRPGGYDDKLVLDIEPLTRTVAQMIHVRSERQKRLEAEVHLSSVVQVCTSATTVFPSY